MKIMMVSCSECFWQEIVAKATSTVAGNLGRKQTNGFTSVNLLEDVMATKPAPDTRKHFGFTRCIPETARGTAQQTLRLHKISDTAITAQQYF